MDNTSYQQQEFTINYGIEKKSMIYTLLQSETGSHFF